WHDRGCLQSLSPSCYGHISSPLGWFVGAIFRFFDYRQDVSRRIFEPGDGGTISPHDPFLVRLEVGQIIHLETDASFRQLIDRKIDILYREIQNRKRGRNMIGLWINENVIATSKPQREDDVRFGTVQAECLGTELFSRVNVCS